MIYLQCDNVWKLNMVICAISNFSWNVNRHEHYEGISMNVKVLYNSPPSKLFFSLLIYGLSL